jgi:glycosyltransferase involved in cell wall biosynthesis
MRQLPSESQITSTWTPYPEKPLLTVFCAAYNHEAFVSDAIESFLTQRTTFPFEIIIHDDASTDRTASIIREYEQQYPNIVKPIYQSRNQYSLLNKPSSFVWEVAQGKYLANCEADDYWRDDLKLQKQVDHLESNPSVVITYHDSIVVDQHGNVVSHSKIPDHHKRDYSAEELARNSGRVLNNTRVYRKVVDSLPLEKKMVLNGDDFMISLLGNFGSGRFMSEVTPAAYRIHSGGVWSQRSPREKQEFLINTRFWLYKYYTRTSNRKHADYYWRKYVSAILKLLTTKELVKAILYRIPKLKSLLRLIR